MRAKTTTAIIYSQGLNEALERNISRLQGWVSEILVMYLGDEGSFIDKIRSLENVRVHRSLWRGSLCDLRNEARGISRGEFHIHFFENESIADSALWPYLHKSVAVMTPTCTGRLAVKTAGSRYMVWQSRVFHRSYEFEGEWRTNPSLNSPKNRHDILFCINAGKAAGTFLPHGEPITLLNKDAENPWSLYEYAESRLIEQAYEEANLLLNTVCQTTLGKDVDLNHAAMMALIECKLAHGIAHGALPGPHLTSERTRESPSYFHMMGDLYAARYASTDDSDDYEMSMEFYVGALGARKVNKLSRHLIGAGSLLTKNKIQRLFDLSRGFA
ncbi:hypothetical protein CL689_04090 [Candidatus Saccharibacteria bacterium]|nr:hypothetical protein [Candidatus Saccharibacteria bacterium]